MGAWTVCPGRSADLSIPMRDSTCVRCGGRGYTVETVYERAKGWPSHATRSVPRGSERVACQECLETGSLLAAEEKRKRLARRERIMVFLRFLVLLAVGLLLVLGARSFDGMVRLIRSLAHG
jgi:hypothetical protein